jgi:hypothetical protein
MIFRLLPRERNIHLRILPPVMPLAWPALHAGETAEVENAQEVSGFWGQVTGKVKPAQADGGGIVLAISEAVVDAERSNLKESAPLLGKELAIGVRMSKNPAA